MFQAFGIWPKCTWWCFHELATWHFAVPLCEHHLQFHSCSSEWHCCFWFITEWHYLWVELNSTLYYLRLWATLLQFCFKFSHSNYLQYDLHDSSKISTNGNVATSFPLCVIFVSPELCSERDYVITLLYVVCSLYVCLCMYVVFCKIDHCIHIHWCIPMGLGHNDLWVG